MPPNIPRVCDDVPAPKLCFASVRSPKSDAFPFVAMVIKSILFMSDGVNPPAKIPLVLDAHE